MAILDESESGGLLLIIGNGFDKECGLSSLFSEFIKDRENKNSDYKKFLEWLQPTNYGHPSNGSVKPPNLSNSFVLWDIYFLLIKHYEGIKDDLPWSSVEEHILESFNVESDSAFAWKNIIRICNSLEGMSPYQNESINHNRIYAYLNQEINKKIDLKTASQTEISHLLLEELKTFEGFFNEYLSDQIKLKDYERNAKELADILAGNDNFGEVKILSFNYTLSSKKDYCINHIHGSLKDRNIIFGTSPYLINDKYAGVELFSKPSRQIMTINLMEGEKRLVTKAYSQIRVFGSSLSEADYPVFFSIFEANHLRTNIDDFPVWVFVCNPSKIENDITIKTEAIEQLFNEYSNITNVFPKTLFSTLVNMGKIRIRTLDDIKKETTGIE